MEGLGQIFVNGRECSTLEEARRALLIYPQGIRVQQVPEPDPIRDAIERALMDYAEHA